MKIENWGETSATPFRRFLKTYEPLPHVQGADGHPTRSGDTPMTGTSRSASRINKKIWDERDLDREQLGMERLDRFTTRFLEMTFYMQPRRVRRAPKRKNIDVAFDGTHVTSPWRRA